jgi:hypothetical protein
MRIRLVAVPPGGGEADYSLEMECPAVPQVGDYITVMREYANSAPDQDHVGTEDFIVRRVRWGFTWPDNGQHYHTSGQEPVGEVDVIVVECEMAIGAYSSPAHKAGAGQAAQHHEASAY